MNARIADNVGILKLKMLVIVSIKEFPRGIKSDQAISYGTASTDDAGVRPGPGLKLRHGGLTPEASGSKRQAPSVKLQASSFRTNLFKRQATSVKPQAASFKRQAASVKLSNSRSMEHGYWRSIRG